MDATPLTLGQEFSGYAAQLAFCRGARSTSRSTALYELALGGTAVGTGLNTHPKWAETRRGARSPTLTGQPFRTAPNKFAALAGHEAIVAASGALRTLAVAASRSRATCACSAAARAAASASSSSPRTSRGARIMPGKVNPTQCEAHDDGVRRR